MPGPGKRLKEGETAPAFAENSTARLFFALWPDDGVRKGLDNAAHSLADLCKGRRVARDAIHMTLAFLGDVSAERFNDLAEAAYEVNVPAFSLELCRLGWWKHNRVAWASPSDIPTALSALVLQLRLALGKRGFPVEERSFAAHVTLMRKVDCKSVPQLDHPIDWSVQEFVLVRSRLTPAGSSYTVLRSWPLMNRQS